MPPNTGAIAFTISDDLVHVLRGQADGKGVDARELLEDERLAFHDGLGARWARCRPSPSTAEPSVTTATVLCLIVSV